jgi:O-antigen biosynthesis protein
VNHGRLSVSRFLSKNLDRKQRAGLVSVIVPALESRADLLASQCLPSVESQTYRSFEVIVASQSFSPGLAEAVRKMGGNYRYFWGTKKSRALRKAGSLANWCSGAAPNLNLAIKKARGAYIARLDDDDEWLPDHLSDAIALLEEGAFEFVSSSAHGPDGAIVENSYLADYKYFGHDFEWLNLSSVVGPTITWVYRRHLRIFKFNVNSWRKKINRPAHYDFMFRIAAAGVSIAYSPAVSARYRSRPGTGGLTGHRAYMVDGDGVVQGESKA